MGEMPPIMQFFTYEHLPGYLQTVSEPFHKLAHHIVGSTVRSAEQSVALRKLLESKDAAVRAAITGAKSEGPA